MKIEGNIDMGGKSISQTNNNNKKRKIMMKIKKEEVREILGVDDNVLFPKYVSGLLNFAFNTSRANAASKIGHVSTEIQSFDEEVKNGSMDDFNEYLLGKFPNREEYSFEKTMGLLEGMKEALSVIDGDVVKDYMSNMKNNTWVGLRVQETLLKKLADEAGSTWRLATQEEEAKGIDGYVGNKAYQVKPTSHKAMGRLGEKFDCAVIYYDKGSNGIKFEIVE